MGTVAFHRKQSNRLILTPRSYFRFIQHLGTEQSILVYLVSQKVLASIHFHSQCSNFRKKREKKLCVCRESGKEASLFQSDAVKTIRCAVNLAIIKSGDRDAETPCGSGFSIET